MPIVVDVTVNTAGGTHTLTVNPDPVHVPVGERGPMQWKITNPAADGWRFKARGIDIVNPGTEFDRPAGGGTRVFTWNNHHTRKDDYKYAVRVENGTARVELDPTIMND
jgi:hypothetical protein